MNPNRKTFVIPANEGSKHSATIIWLHGLGDESNGWAQELYDLKAPHVSMVFPKAPDKWVSLYQVNMPAWFNMGDTDKDEDDDGIKASTKLIVEILRDEIKGTKEKPGIPPNRIILGGFSQGGTLALHVGLQGPETLAGIACLSGHLALCKQIKWDVIKRPHVFLAQGNNDKLIPMQFGTMTYKALKDNIPKVDFKVYDGLTHNWNEEELTDLKEYFDKVLPPI